MYVQVKGNQDKNLKTILAFISSWNELPSSLTKDLRQIKVLNFVQPFVSWSYETGDQDLSFQASCCRWKR